MRQEMMLARECGRHGVRVVKLLGVGSGAAVVCWRGLAVPLLPKSRGHCGALPASGGELPVIKNRPWVRGLDGSSCTFRTTRGL
jgi:hypothetical protein